MHGQQQRAALRFLLLLFAPNRKRVIRKAVRVAGVNFPRDVKHLHRCCFLRGEQPYIFNGGARSRGGSFCSGCGVRRFCFSSSHAGSKASPDGWVYYEIKLRNAHLSLEQQQEKQNRLEAEPKNFLKTCDASHIRAANRCPSCFEQARPCLVHW